MRRGKEKKKKKRRKKEEKKKKKEKKSCTIAIFSKSPDGHAVNFSIAVFFISRNPS